MQMNGAARSWTLADKVAFLRDAGNYPGEPIDVKVEVIETHFAWVFLTRRHAYKLKKPLQQGSMDYRQLAARERGCRQELRLNRRLASSIYLRVLPLTSDNGTLLLGGGGAIQDWVLKMRRLDSRQMLDQILARRALTQSELRRLISALVRFFVRARPVRIGDSPYLARLRRRAAANRQVLRRAGPSIPQELLDAVASAQRRFVARARECLGSRSARVIEGHGDLRAEHVHLGRPLCIIDCLEFSRELRELDPADELAHLAVETDRLGHPCLAGALLKRYRAAMRDPVDQAIVSFYKSHRALTRAKLCMWHVGDPHYPNARPWIRRAGSYLKDADRYIKAALDRASGHGLAPAGERPVRQQRRQGRTGQHACDRLPEQRRNRQRAQLVARPE
jgi:uncharacterized protein